MQATLRATSRSTDINNRETEPLLFIGAEPMSDPEIIKALSKANPNMRPIASALGRREQLKSEEIVGLLKDQYNPGEEQELEAINESAKALKKLVIAHKDLIGAVLKFGRKVASPDKLMDDLLYALEQRDFQAIEHIALQWLYYTGNWKLFRIEPSNKKPWSKQNE